MSTEHKHYRASLLPYVLAIATSGDEGELEAQQATVLLISRTDADSDASCGCGCGKGHVTVTEFYGCSLLEAVIAARAFLPFECASFASPDGDVQRLYIPHPDVIAAAADPEAISYHASYNEGNGDLTILSVADDDEDADEYLHILSVDVSVPFEQRDRVLFAGDSLLECVAAVKRHMTVRKVINKTKKQRQSQETPWRDDNIATSK